MPGSLARRKASHLNESVRRDVCFPPCPSVLVTTVRMVMFAAAGTFRNTQRQRFLNHTGVPGYCGHDSSPPVEGEHVEGQDRHCQRQTQGALIAD